jgi:hypothetical protein
VVAVAADGKHSRRRGLQHHQQRLGRVAVGDLALRLLEFLVDPHGGLRQFGWQSWLNG